MAGTSGSHIACETRDGRAHIAIDRPAERNALTCAMLDEIALRGAGSDLCAGHDLDQAAGMYGMNEAPVARVARAEKGTA